MAKSGFRYRTVKELVDALGGPSAVAGEMKIGQSAVSNWVCYDTIPAGRHIGMTVLVMRRGIDADVDPQLLGLASFDDLRPARSRRGVRAA